MKRRSKFTLGPKPSPSPAPAPATASSPRKRLPRYETPKQSSKPKTVFRPSPPLPDPDPEEEEEIVELTPVDTERSALPRAQLELEYRTALQEREMLLNQLAGVLEDLIVTVPAD